MPETIEKPTTDTNLTPAREGAVLVWNSDFVAFHGVIDILAQVFALSVEDATKIAIAAHTHDKAEVKRYASLDLAETMALRAASFAVQSGWPDLKFTAEIV